MVVANGVEVIPADPLATGFDQAMEGGRPSPETQKADDLLNSLYNPPAAAAGGEEGQPALEPQPLVDPILDRLGPELSGRIFKPQVLEGAQDVSSQPPTDQPDPSRILLEQTVAMNRQLAAQMAATQQQLQELQSGNSQRLQAFLERQEETRNNPTLTPEQKQAQAVKEWNEFNNSSPTEMINKIVAPLLQAHEQRIAEMNAKLEKANVPLKQYEQRQAFESGLSALSTPGADGSPAPFPEMANPKFQAFAFSKPVVDQVLSAHPVFRNQNLTAEQVFADPNLLYALAQEARYQASRLPSAQDAGRAAAQARARQAEIARGPVTPGGRQPAAPAKGPVSADDGFKMGLLNAGKSFDQAIADAGAKRG